MGCSSAMLSQLLRVCVGACTRRCRACFAVRRCASQARLACEKLTCPLACTLAGWCRRLATSALRAALTSPCEAQPVSRACCLRMRLFVLAGRYRGRCLPPHAPRWTPFLSPVRPLQLSLQLRPPLRRRCCLRWTGVLLVARQPRLPGGCAPTTPGACSAAAQTCLELVRR